MHDLSHKLLLVLLVLSLSLMPISNALAYVPVSSDSGKADAHVMHMQSAMDMQTDSSPQTCKHCADNCCAQNNSCNGGLCNICLNAVVSVYSLPAVPPSSSYLPQAISKQQALSLDSLFRPPRV